MTLEKRKSILSKDGNIKSQQETVNRDNTNGNIPSSPKPILQRSKSEIKLERKNILFNKLKNVHEEKQSLLSSQSGFDNYRGFINLSLLLLVLSNFRVALDNVLKYGVIVDPYLIFVVLEDPYNWPSCTLVIGSNVFIQIAFVTERLLAKSGMTENVGLCIHIVNFTMLIFVPIFVVVKLQPLPWFATVALCWYSGVVLKLVSYIAVNRWCREEKIVQRTKDPDLKPTGPVLYPDNLTQKDLYYFMVAPTYCYELNFPKTKRICKRFLIRRILEAVFLSGLIFALGQQWIVPTVKNSVKPFQELDFPRFMERIMKLAIPNHLLWLMFFYLYFHSFLNIVAELLFFADRTFYKDWWNAQNVTYFWQNWNIPIHRWAKRHVYEPILRNGYTKIQASLSVFFISAFFHEFIVSVPLRMIKPWAFASMLMQVPLAIVTSYMRNPWGNICMWLSLIIGQPLAIMMYYHDYFHS